MKQTLRRMIDRLAVRSLAESTSLARRTLHLAGVQAARALKVVGHVDHLSDVEFRVTSQFGEDGIIEWLVQQMPGLPEKVVEFGVENYAEANTRFLVENRNWSALVIDGSEANIAQIKADPIMWRHHVIPKAAFITRDNINSLISDGGFQGEIGILSVDIDGVDYWIWEAIDCIRPAIVICEYNAVLGDVQPLTVPYRPDFVRGSAHYSNLYAGTSIAALCSLATRRGYVLAGSNGAGNNAFFIRRDHAEGLMTRIAHPTARPSKFRESRDRDGNLSFLTGMRRAETMADMPFVDVETGRTLTLGEAGPLYSPQWQAWMEG